MQEENAYEFENLPIPDTVPTVKAVTRSKTKSVVDVVEEAKSNCVDITPPLVHKEADTPVSEHKTEAENGKERPESLKTFVLDNIPTSSYMDIKGAKEQQEWFVTDIMGPRCEWISQDRLLHVRDVREGKQDL